ncbi:MAG: 23S rRNA (guanosine(2251)-2'-O)-methyltransferase RlmB [Clostridiales bacterium]|nr:23S rRNA (guanosine(2251)-2'-O)-methyltransferase RlmB [Clostridiales bacterium]
MKIEGRNAVYELLKTDKEIDKILVQKDLKDDASKRLINVIRSHKVKLQPVDKYVIEKESESKRHQGFIAYVSDYKYFEIEDIIDDCADKDGLVVVLNEILDPHNLGSIIRVCECAGADGIIIGKDRSASVSDTVMRISAGALNHIKVAKVTNINNAIDKLKENGFWVYGAEVGGGNIYKSNLTGKICLVIGGEDSGVKRLTKEKCDGIISIPMFGKVNSLNASVACGIAVYEVVRQRVQTEKA